MAKGKSPYYKGNNEGGYGNPPVKYQFEENNRGGGRPNGCTSMNSAMKKVFGKDVKLRVRDGEVSAMPATLALAERILQLGLTGSARAN